MSRKRRESNLARSRLTVREHSAVVTIQCTQYDILRHNSEHIVLSSREPFSSKNSCNRMYIGT